MVHGRRGEDAAGTGWFHRAARHTNCIDMDTQPHQPTTTVFYDGACPICSREISQYRRAAGAERLAFIDAASCAPDALDAGLTRQAALAQLHVRLADGSLVSGVAAFAALWRQLPRLAWAGRIAGSPAILPLLTLGYRVFLRVRRLWRR